MESAAGLFPDAGLIQITARQHDRAMGLILSLTHLLNIAYAATVAKHLSSKEFRRLESPTSAVQLSVAEGVLSQDPALYSYIQLENEHSARLAGELIANLTKLRSTIVRKDRKAFEKIFSGLSEIYADDSKTALDSVYEAFEVKQSR
jgi:prephenate dehydrogenase